MNIIEKRTKAQCYCNSRKTCEECPAELSEYICQEYNFFGAPEEILDIILEIAETEDKAQ